MVLSLLLLVFKGFLDGFVLGRVHTTQFSTVGLFRGRSFAARSLFGGLLQVAGELVGGVIIFWLMVYMKVCSTISYPNISIKQTISQLLRENDLNLPPSQSESAGCPVNARGNFGS